MEEEQQSPTQDRTEDVSNVSPPEANDETKKDDVPESEEGQGDESGPKMDIPEVTVTSSSSIHLTPDMLEHRPSMALQSMDLKHSWLAELEEKASSADTQFMSRVQFVALSNHFQRFIDEELVPAESVVPEIRGEFSHLFSRFRNCFASGERLRSKVFEERSLKKMVSSEGMVFERRMRDKDDQMKVMAERMTEAVKMAEERAKEVAALRMEFSEFRAKVTLGKAEDAEDEDDPTTAKTPGSLAAEEDENKMKIMQLEAQIEELEEELSFANERESIYSRKVEQGNQERSQLKKEMTVAKSELQKQLSLREKAEEQVGETASKLEQVKAEVRQLSEKIEKLERELEVETNLAKSLYKDLKKLQRESDRKTAELEKSKRNLSNRDDRIRQMTTQKENLELEIEEKQSEISGLKAEKASLTKAKNDLTRRAAQLEDTVKELDKSVNDLSEASRAQLRKIDAMDKEHADSEARIKDLTKQRNEMKDEVIKVEQECITLRSQIKGLETGARTLTHELDGFKREVERVNMVLNRERKEKQRLSSEILHKSKAIEELKTDIKAQNLKFSESEKTVAALNKELAEAAVKYKNVSEDNRFYRKTAAEYRRVIEQQSQQKSMLQLTVHHLESCVQDLETRLRHVTVDLKNSTEELRQSREVSKQWAKKHEALGSRLTHAEDREQACLRRESEFEKEIHNLERKMKNLLQEKDALVTRVQEREDDIALNKDRIRQLEHEASLADKTINARVDDIRLLKLQLTEMTRGVYLMEGQVDKFQETRQELTEVCRELQEHKTMTKGLEGEMQKPVNLHRWRVLEGTDPDRAQLLTKTHTLQRELAKKNSELEAKEKELVEKNTELERLRAALAKAPQTGPGSFEDFELRRELRARADRLKGLTAENSMMEGVIVKYRREVTALKEELSKMKLKEFKMKGVKTKKGGVRA